ncbi:cytochrome P450 2 sub U member 1 [Rhizopus stolonifer]|uniref:Cytochrome P450 2 sub U member 1 n=1 Tax=Rhizopus stolonifer TaxID=4846 RepID=A0A367KVK4_RHIST|nr:cytochrome P450 2 sub U member 1 [Rhizopus stolonifer]
MDKAAEYLKSIRLPSRFEQEHIFPAVSIAAVLLYSSYQLLHQNKKSVTDGLIKEIPTPGSHYPYVGHLLSLGELPGAQVSKWHKELGPIIQLRMGQQRWIMVDDPNLAHKIFVGRGADASNRPHITYAIDYYGLGGHGIVFSQPGTSFKKNRAAALSVLAPKQMDNFLDNIKKESADFVHRLIEATEKEGNVNPLKFLELNTMNVIFQACFGRRFDSVDDPEFSKLAHMVETSMKYAGLEEDLPSFLPILSLFNYFSNKTSKWKNFINNERNPIYIKLIEEALKKEEPNVVKSLDENGFPMSMEEKIVFMSDLIAAGTDTISVTLSWNFVLMCHHPETQKRVVEEIDAFIQKHERTPSFADRLELPFCISVIKECMRYRPISAFGLPHAAAEDIEVDGYFIPKGSTIISNMGSMHSNPDRYDDPDVFKPDRFMNNLKTMQSSANGRIEERDQYNFGWGRRICPGIYLAEVEIFAAFIQLFARCYIEPSDQGLPDLEGATNAGLTLLPLPYKLKFVKRANALVK